MLLERPLPDERPRQSVANLIGRFEQQNKRTSIANTPPRAPISLPNHTADSHKDAAKDTHKEPLALELGSGVKPKEQTQQLNSSAIDKESNGLDSVAAAESLALDSSSKTSSMTEKLPPSTSRAQAQPSATPLKSTPSQVSGQSKRDARLPASQSSPSKITTPSRLSSQPVTKPLKAQNTGQSATSTTSTVRGKTPMRSNPVTPARSKTPSTTRPKTPSSSLYAPTAASLAKAREATPPVPSAKRRASVVEASSVSDRLLRPTAASASKAKALSAATASSKTTPPAARGVKSTRGTPVKPRPSTSASTLALSPSKSTPSPSKSNDPSINAVSVEKSLEAGMADHTESIDAETGLQIMDVSTEVEESKDLAYPTSLVERDDDIQHEEAIDEGLQKEDFVVDHVDEPVEITSPPGAATISASEDLVAEEISETPLILSTNDKVELDGVRENMPTPTTSNIAEENHCALEDANILKSGEVVEHAENDVPATQPDESNADNLLNTDEDQSSHSMQDVPKVMEEDNIQNLVNMLETKSRPLSVASIPDDEEY